MNVDDRGQVIMLAALAVSVCLIALAMYLLSVENAETVENPRPVREALENVIWAQDIGLKDIASVTGSYPWDRRLDLGNSFKNGADRLIRDITRDMLARRIAFSFGYNNTLAAEYAASSGEITLANVGGVLVKKSNNVAFVCGYAYDVSVTDGSARYCISKVVCWG